MIVKHFSYRLVMLGRIGSSTLGKSAKEGRSATVVRTTCAMVAAAIALAVVGIGSSIHESDAVSVERQYRSVHHAIETSIDELALQQEAVAVWDDGALHLVARRPDLTWIHDNMGGWLFRLFGHNEVFFLDGVDRPIYASVMGRLVPPQRYASLTNDLNYLVDSVRGREGGPNGKHDRNPAQPLNVGSTVRTTARTTHDSHLMLVGGRPAVASAMLVQPATKGHVKPAGNWPILLSVRYLDGSFLKDLETRQLVAAPRFSRTPEVAAGEHAVKLRTEWGEEIGNLIWKPELPGSRIASKLVPLSLLTLAGFGVLLVFMGRRLRRAVEDAAAAARKASHLALHDPLTGLANRSVLQNKLEELTSGKSGSRTCFALILLDLDEFKITNDTLGHDAGDAILKAVATRLSSFARSGDVVARLGGDEFGLLVVGVADFKHVRRFSRELLDVLSEPVEHHDKIIDCQASAGASLYLGRDTSGDVLKQADLALYASKAGGRGTFRLYEPSMLSSMRVRQKMLAMAKSAIEEDLVEAYYQPKVDLRSGRIVGFEALLRCCPPGVPLYGPHRIAAAFEDRALAAQLGHRMLSRVVADVARWRAAEIEFGHIAINAAAADLRRRNFADDLLREVSKAGLSPSDIQLEITESVLLGRTAAHVQRMLEKLHDEGVKVALDDFGTGFASLSHLKQFPVDIIKIDRAFIRNLLVDEEDGAIVHALIGLAEALRLEVVAEGIETAAQRDFLAALGCATGQGYLFGRAVPAAHVPEMLDGQMRSAVAAA